MTAVIAVATVLGATLLPARAQFTGLTGFGDSYADTGAAPGGAIRILQGSSCPPSSVPQYPDCRFTGGPTTFVDTLQSIYGLSGLTNFSIGGARTDVTNTFGIADTGFANELYTFATMAMRFAKSDLVTLSIGGNDLSAADPTQIQASAVASAQRAVNGGIVVNGFLTGGVQQLVAAGARNISWLSPGNTNYFPVPPGTFNPTQRDDWAHTYYQQIQILLQPLAQSGVRIFLFDYETFQARVAANPGQYGFASDPTCQAYASGNPNCFYDNTVHPTSTGMALIARFMANQIDAPTTVVSQGAIATGLAGGFSGAVLGRLDAERTFQPFGTGSAMAMAYAGATKAAAPAAAAAAADKRWSIYSDVNYAGGSRDSQFLAAGYDYKAAGGTLGVEYRYDRNWRLGGVFGYSDPDVDLGIQNAHNRVNAYQFAGYGSFTDTNWFADALMAYGHQDFALDRQGVNDTISAATSADTFTAAGKAGYLVDLGPVRAGPIAGINYTRAVIRGYTEGGDILLTMMVDRQSLDALTGSAGLQLRYPFMLGQGLYNPFLNVTAEHDFVGSGRVVTTTQVTAPLLPVLTPVPDAGGQTYGKVAAGIAAAVTANLSVTVSAATTFAREGGNDLAISSGIKALF